MKSANDLDRAEEFEKSSFLAHWMHFPGDGKRRSEEGLPMMGMVKAFAWFALSLAVIIIYIFLPYFVF